MEYSLHYKMVSVTVYGAIFINNRISEGNLIINCSDCENGCAAILLFVEFSSGYFCPPKMLVLCVALIEHKYYRCFHSSTMQRRPVHFNHSYFIVSV